MTKDAFSASSRDTRRQSRQLPWCRSSHMAVSSGMPMARLGGDDHRDGAVRPVLAGRLVAGVGVDGVLVRGAPLGGREAEGEAVMRRAMARRTVAASGPRGAPGVRHGSDAAMLRLAPSRSARRRAVHERGNKRLDAVLDFVAFAARPMPLAHAPRRGAAPHRASSSTPTCARSTSSRATGASSSCAATSASRTRAIGAGAPRASARASPAQAVEYMRPISTEHRRAARVVQALRRARRGALPGLPRRPHPRQGRAARRARRAAARAARSTIATSSCSRVSGGSSPRASATPSSSTRRARSAPRRTGGGTRKVTLTGRPVIVGRALGRRRRAAPPARRARASGRPHASAAREGDVRLLRGRVRRRREGHPRAARAGARHRPRARRARSWRPTWRSSRTPASASGRPSSRASGVGLAQALSQVARDVTRTAVSITRDPFLEERARDIEDLCDALTMLADSDKRAALPSKALLVGDTLTVFDLLVSARSQPVGVALSERAPRPADARAPQAAQRARGRRRAGAVPVGVRRRHRAARRRPRPARDQPEQERDGEPARVPSGGPVVRSDDASARMTARRARSSRDCAPDRQSGDPSAAVARVTMGCSP